MRLNLEKLSRPMPLILLCLSLQGSVALASECKQAYDDLIDTATEAGKVNGRSKAGELLTKETDRLWKAIAETAGSLIKLHCFYSEECSQELMMHVNARANMEWAIWNLDHQIGGHTESEVTQAAARARQASTTYKFSCIR